MKRRLALPGWPRALREPLAAEYVGLGASTFRQVVVPAVPAIRLTAGRVAWLREDLDRWLDERRASEPNPVDAGSPDTDAAPREAFDIHAAIAAGLANLPPKRRSRRPHEAG